MKMIREFVIHGVCKTGKRQVHPHGGREVKIQSRRETEIRQGRPVSYFLSSAFELPKVFSDTCRLPYYHAKIG